MSRKTKATEAELRKRILELEIETRKLRQGGSAMAASAAGYIEELEKAIQKPRRILRGTTTKSMRRERWRADVCMWSVLS